MPEPVDRTGVVAPAAAARVEPAPRTRGGALRGLAALVAGALAAAIAWRYPLLPSLVMALLLVYAGVLWRWPLLWLAVVPAALPGVDLGPWSGWTEVEEPDLVARGLERWLPTDDDHAIWRIKNQYLMSFFEQGALGLAALLLLAAAALRDAWRAAARGNAMAPALAASIAAVLASSLFDCPLEVPRLAALFYLIAFAALAVGDNAAPENRRA